MELTQEWIEQFNKKCAEFLGAYWCNDDLENFPDGYWMIDGDLELPLHLRDFQFHSDWNWIMEIVDKIESLEDKQFYMEWFWLNKTNVGLYQRETNSGSTLWEYIARFSDAKTKKQAVIQAIDQFIDWYNKQKEL